MNFAWSLWTLPASLKSDYSFSFNDIKDFLISLKLSTSLLKPYGKCFFIGDSKALSLVLRVGIEFDEMIEMDIDCSDSRGWSLGKIESYRIMSNRKEPFLHIDADAYVWRGFAEDFLESSLMCQNEEPISIVGFYDEAWEDVKRNEFSMKNSWKEMNISSAFNCGIFGGSDYDFIDSYCQEVFDFAKANVQNIDKLYPEYSMHYAMILEQYLLALHLKETDRKIEKLLNFSSIDSDCERLKFTHLVGDKKKDENLMKLVRSHAEKRNPSFLEKLNEKYFGDFFYFTNNV